MKTLEVKVMGFTPQRIPRSMTLSVVGKSMSEIGEKLAKAIPTALPGLNGEYVVSAHYVSPSLRAGLGVDMDTDVLTPLTPTELAILSGQFAFHIAHVKDQLKEHHNAQSK